MSVVAQDRAASGQRPPVELADIFTRHADAYCGAPPNGKSCAPLSAAAPLPWAGIVSGADAVGTSVIYTTVAATDIVPSVNPWQKQVGWRTDNGNCFRCRTCTTYLRCLTNSMR